MRTQDEAGKDKSGLNLGRTLWNDLGRGDIKNSWKRDWQDLYQFYLDDEDRRRLAKMNRLERFFSISYWLFKNLFFHLTPARRVLLGFAVLFFLTPNLDFGLLGVKFTLHFRSLSFLVVLFVLMLELKDKLLAHDELEVGREVQLALLPQDNPRLDGWDVWMYTRPANNVGGDLVDYLFIEADRLAVSLGDVAGKGLGAALLMAKLQATLRALAAETRDLAELGSRVNGILQRDGVPGRFATLVYLEMQPGGGEIRLLNAGHPPPLVLRAAGLETLSAVAPPIGILPDVTFIEQRLDLVPGDMVVIFSDGLPEAANEAGDFFGDDRVEILAPRLRGLTAAQAGAAILAEVSAYTGAARVHDDLSLIILKKL